jgi:hypothetical protein
MAKKTHLISVLWRFTDNVTLPPELRGINTKYIFILHVLKLINKERTTGITFLNPPKAEPYPTYTYT